jgi:hypothetical protein
MPQRPSLQDSLGLEHKLQLIANDAGSAVSITRIEESTSQGRPNVCANGHRADVERTDRPNAVLAMVKHVEELTPEFQVHPFGQIDDLGNVRIKAILPRRAGGKPAKVARGARRRRVHAGNSTYIAEDGLIGALLFSGLT